MRVELSPRARWVYALKPASWPKVLVPAGFGQVLGALFVGRLHLGALALGAMWTMMHLAFVVLLNDWGDREVDAIKRRMFPLGCSPKTIPDGILAARQLLVAGVVACALALVFAWGAGELLGRPLLFPLAVLSALVFVAYTLPPLKLNYRGGGELLEMAGIGVLLPLMHDYMQSGVLITPWLRMLLPALAALALASALASGLSDEVSDRMGGKRTFVTTFGNAAARAAIEALFGLASVLLLSACCWPAGLPLSVALPAALVVLFFLFRLAQRSPRAFTNEFSQHAAYKRALHLGIWVPMFLIALLLVLRSVLGLDGELS